MFEIGDTVFYLDNLSFYKVKILDINKKNQALVEENDGDWLVFNIKELYTEESMLERMKGLY